MKAKILEKSEEKLWENFARGNPISTIHQSLSWAHFQDNVSSRGKYWIIVLEENKKIIGGTLLVRHRLPKGFTWLYAPRGPLLDYSADVQAQMDELLKAAKSIAKKENSIFLRIDPPLIKGSHPHKTFKTFHETHTGFQPEHTLILDITQSEDEILKQMKPKGRYNIRLAEKKGVKIHVTKTSDKSSFSRDLEAFYDILSTTTKRDGFSGHDKEFYETMLQSLVPTRNASLYLAEYEGKIIAGVIVTYFSDTATYYYGASSNEYRNVMAPYLLHWKIIKDAASDGFKYYDFFGISPEGAKNHPWRGVTDFKEKFGGQKISYFPPQEHAFRPFFYLLYRLYKFIRK
ncbi:MAG: peptidoglycan bridge formation glycyltransferase FemA/FemB family protein [Candidatus Peregrinibacteria bacterium]